MQKKFDAAKSLYFSGFYFDCLAACEEILAEDPDNADVLNLVGMLCFRAGDSAAAESYFRQSIARQARHAEAHANLGLMLKQRGAFAEALEVYRTSVELDGRDSQAQYNYGLALRATFQLDKAAEALGRAAELNPYLPDIHAVLGNVLLDLRRPDDAVRSFRKAIAAQPTSAQAYRDLVVALLRSASTDEALDALRWGVANLGLAALGHDLVSALEEAGQSTEAANLLETMLSATPGDAAAWEKLGRIHLRLGRFEDSLAALQRAVAEDGGRASAHMQIFAVAQILDQPALALAHQQKALAQRRLFSEFGEDPRLPTLLILKAPGDWQGNLPTDFLIRPSDWSVVHTYYVDASRPPPIDQLPGCDLIINALGEADLLQGELATVTAIRDSMPGTPFVNHPEGIIGSGRQTVAEALADVAGCIVPTSLKLDAATAEARLSSLLAAGQLAFPLLIRPTGTHAGQGMQLVADPSALSQVLDELAGRQIYVTQFIDYRSPDGLYRKYRIAVVDGLPLPFHMAISKLWMVHYYNADLDDFSQMRREEEFFLANFPKVFSAPLCAAIGEIHRRVGLDFFALDCAIAEDGRLIVFEVAVNAIIHLMEDPQEFPYKHQYVPRIFEAMRAMLMKRLRDPARPLS